MEKIIKCKICNIEFIQKRKNSATCGSEECKKQNRKNIIKQANNKKKEEARKLKEKTIIENKVILHENNIPIRLNDFLNCSEKNTIIKNAKKYKVKLQSKKEDLFTEKGKTNINFTYASIDNIIDIANSIYKKYQIEKNMNLYQSYLYALNIIKQFREYLKNDTQSNK